MRGQPVGIVGGFYADDSLPWSSQDTLNWLPVVAEVAGTKTTIRFATPPGLKPYQEIGTGPIRGMHDLEGGRFIVSGSMLYRISTSGVGVPIGVIPGVGRVSMTHNQFKTGYQLLVENGEGGGGYVYDSNTKAFGKITDEAYPGSISTDYLDSYMLGVEPLGRFWFHSNLADATDYNSLDRYESEASPDRIVGLAVSQFEIVVFNQRTTEFFYNTGQATGTFQNRRQSVARGCASRHSIAKLDNTLFWLGDDGIVYRMAGYSAQPISTGPMHRAWANLDWSDAYAYVWEDRGFKVYYLTFPGGKTWGYDVVSGLWTRRGSYGLDIWRPTHAVKWGQQWYVGDFQSGRTYELNWDYYLEVDQEFISERVTPQLSDNQSNLGIPFAELQFDTGQGPMTEAIPFPAQPLPPSVAGDSPNGTVGVAYPGYQYTITPGGGSVQTVVVSGGNLPAGMSLSNTGFLSGPTFVNADSGVYRYTIKATDANELWATLADSITIPFVANPTGYNLPQQTPSTGFTITLPAFVAGDLMVVHIATGSTSVTTPGIPSGWTSVANTNINTSSSARLGSRWIYRVMQTGDSTSLILSASVSSAWAVQAWNFKQRGAAPSLQANYGTLTTNVATRPVPAITPSWGSGAVIRIAAYVGLYSDTSILPLAYPYPNGNLSTTSTLGVASFMPQTASCHQTLSGATFPVVNYTTGNVGESFPTNLLIKAG